MSDKNQGPVQQQFSKSGGSFSKYRQSVVGNSSLLVLLWYEFIHFACLSMPGRLGNSVRWIVLKPLVRALGRNVAIGKNCFFLQPNKLQLKDGLKVGDNVHLAIKNEGLTIHLSSGVIIKDETIINCAGGEIIIGNNTRIGRQCRLGTLAGLKIGDGCVLEDRVCVIGAGHDYKNFDIPIIDQPLTSNGQTIIENNVTIGHDVTILDGVFIGSNAHIQDNSFVNQDVAANIKVTGVPARQI